MSTRPAAVQVFGTPTSSQTMHAHFAVKIVVSWSGPFEVETVSGIERNVYGRVFNSLERHRIQSEHRCASLFVFPSSKATRIWLRQWPPPDDDARAYLQQRLKDFDSGTKSYDDAHVLAHAFQSIWLVGFDDPPFCDPRITKVVDWLGKRSVPTTDRFLLASIAGLSPSRFAALFKAEVGMSISRYLIWRKLLFAVRLLVGGRSVTTASIEAGFSDTAHFSRLYRSTFGSTPSFLSRAQTRDSQQYPIIPRFDGSTALLHDAKRE